MQGVKKSKKILTLLLIHQSDKLLLGFKKRGFGAHKYNGFGGKVETNQTIYQAAIRETQQQSGVTPTDAFPLGLIHFEFKGDPVILQVHLFKATTFTGTPVQTEEMKPQWFPTGGIPFNQMWLDDQHWFPYMLSNRYFKAYFLFQGHNVLLKKSITELTKDELQEVLKIQTSS